MNNSKEVILDKYSLLSDIGKKFNKEGILWAVGASIVLNYYNLIENPNDIDILVSLKDIEKADNILKEMGIKKEYKKTEDYSTEYFYEYVIENIDIDVMSGFKINHKDGVFEYIFDEKSIDNVMQINGENIPLTSLEDWYVIYQLIEGREYKVQKIEKYLNDNGIKNNELLKRSLNGILPNKVKERISKLI
ncbi:nucleotidyltransferase family protein [Clostridium sp. Ade.TY]|uniref:nucleotidyltransferase family protein n=1 Tax=Clostridium sp. Ade.TY TaxID=1391647 RepID=UPI00041032CB|nr:nucleotidyltransferase family protein [Clostridium sp. Ade.TY]